jgi:hypothetical protein
MTVFWDFAPCSLVEIDRRFRSAYCLHPGRWVSCARESEFRYRSRSDKVKAWPDRWMEVGCGVGIRVEDWLLQYVNPLYRARLILIALMMEAVSTSETLVNFCEIARRKIPEDSLHLYSPPWEPEIALWFQAGCVLHCISDGIFFNNNNIFWMYTGLTLNILACR